MSRAKTIDENTILDAAEAVIREDGAAGLTIEAVARKAGVSVGGLQLLVPLERRSHRRHVRTMGP
ncbi:MULTISPECIES: helix-turn-helix domain-containing protein [Hyphomicrobiales]|uniref:helix-turn-helix domain-containing protein n=1 Tax=Hyphomicrobiales TaxID=356 RepID=UPI001F5701B7|nr:MULTISPECIES: helix-turn-helix domain-containing protein [Hyphomicrobiales]MCR8492651.1 TetR/AcrR family transcriptional regulator [Brucella anthropi]